MVSNTHSIEQNPNLPELINQQANEQTCAPHLFSVRSVTTENTDASPEAIPLTVLATEGSKGGKAGEGGEGGEGGVFSTVETDQNPGLPWPQPGDTLLPGWGDRVSIEYRLRVASEEECLEWAKEFWQLDLVAKARGYPKKWAVQTSRNQLMWSEAFTARDECRAPNFEQLREAVSE